MSRRAGSYALKSNTMMTLEALAQGMSSLTMTRNTTMSGLLRNPVQILSKYRLQRTPRSGRGPT